MDLSEPARALAQGLTMPVLRALNKRDRPATATQVHRAAGTGTLAGIQRACERLVAHGLVLSEEAGGRVVYEMNDRHVLYDVVQPLLRTTGVLHRLLRAHIDEWGAPPLSAALFGSAARGDGDIDSDIDLLLVRPPLRQASTATWAHQVRTLKRDVEIATGNRLQVLNLTRTELRDLVREGDPIVQSWHVEAVTVAGEDIDDLLDALA